MLIDARDLEPDALVRADVCVAGAGAAGITLALELAGSGLSVCVLEGGGLGRADENQALFGGDELNHPADILPARTRALGGTTDVWAGWCRPLDPEDFEPAQWRGELGWPFGRDHLDPFYRRAQETCEAGAFDYDAAGMAARAGKPALPLDPARVATLVYQYSPPTRFGRRYRDELDAAQDVEVYLHANLVEVRLEEGGQAVSELRCATLGGQALTVRAQRYVLALGGLENARILLASNQQQQAGVGNGEDLVGRYFMEHPHWYSGAYMVLWDAGDMRLYERAGALTVDDEHPAGIEVPIKGALGVASALRAAEGLPTWGATLSEQTGAREVGRTGEVDARRLAPLLGAAPDSARVFTLTVRTEQRPLRDSRVLLGSGRDALGLPPIQLDWRIAEQDQHDMLRSLRIVAAELGRTGLGRLWAPHDGAGAYAPLRYAGGGHHMGTTRMAPSADRGVVDPQGRVHGLSNLYVAGSSVFPTVGLANPTLTIVALAHRLADHLKETRR